LAATSTLHTPPRPLLTIHDSSAFLLNSSGAFPLCVYFVCLENRTHKLILCLIVQRCIQIVAICTYI